MKDILWKDGVSVKKKMNEYSFVVCFLYCHKYREISRVNLVGMDKYIGNKYLYV